MDVVVLVKVWSMSVQLWVNLVEVYCLEWTEVLLITVEEVRYIVLLHRFTESGGSVIIKSCNNGAIIGRGLSVKGNVYTSQLNTNTVTHDIAGKIIMCVYDATL